MIQQGNNQKEFQIEYMKILMNNQNSNKYKLKMIIRIMKEIISKIKLSINLRADLMNMIFTDKIMKKKNKKTPKKVRHPISIIM